VLILVFLLRWGFLEIPTVSIIIIIIIQMQFLLQGHSRLQCTHGKTKGLSDSRKSDTVIQQVQLTFTLEGRFATVIISTSTSSVNFLVLKASTPMRMPAPLMKMNPAPLQAPPSQEVTRVQHRLRGKRMRMLRIARELPMESIVIAAIVNFLVTTILSRLLLVKTSRKCGIVFVCGFLLRNGILRHRNLPLPARLERAPTNINTIITTIRNNNNHHNNNTNTSSNNLLSCTESIITHR